MRTPSGKKLPIPDFDEQISAVRFLPSASEDESLAVVTAWDGSLILYDVTKESVLYHQEYVNNSQEVMPILSLAPVVIIVFVCWSPGL